MVAICSRRWVSLDMGGGDQGRLSSRRRGHVSIQQDTDGRPSRLLGRSLIGKVKVDVVGGPVAQLPRGRAVRAGGVVLAQGRGVSRVTGGRLGDDRGRGRARCRGNIVVGGAVLRIHACLCVGFADEARRGRRWWERVTPYVR